MGGGLKIYLKEYFTFEKFKTLKKGGPGSRLAGGSSPTPSQSSEKTLTEAEIAVSMTLTFPMCIAVVLYLSVTEKTLFYIFL